MTGNKWALALAAGAFTTMLIGSVALATFQPLAIEQSNAIPPTANAVTDRDSSKTRIKAALDALVTKGTITQAQEDAVRQALTNAAAPAKPKPPVGPRVPNSRSFIGDLMGATRTYLGMGQKDLAMQLHSGKSIADIANSLAGQGKSATDLIGLLTKSANDTVDQAVSANTLTADQAAALKPKIAAEISSFVHRSFTKPAPRPVAPLKPSPAP